MNDSLQEELAKKIKELENRIDEAYEAGKKKFSYQIEQGKAIFQKEIGALHKKASKNIFVFILRAPLGTLLTAPIIYSILFPVLLLDLFATVYQWICMPIYKIERVKRRHHITFDRHRLKYLNFFEKINCIYCSYVNGFISYIAEIAGRTEQYFCPIKHSKRLKNRHNYYQNFLDYGDYEDYHERLKGLRFKLKQLEESDDEKKDSITTKRKLKD